MANRVLIGKMNKANGEMFETWISNSCEEYRDSGIAFIEKTPEPFHITGKSQDGIVHGYYAQAAQPDYKGILYGGRGIMFEAKHTETGKINKKAVTERQAENLTVYYKFGAICFVIVSLGFESFYRVPWKVWMDMKALYGHQYMNEEELKPFQIKATINQIQFLDGIDEFHEKWRYQ